jgi:hypothetical protein
MPLHPLGPVPEPCPPKPETTSKPCPCPPRVYRNPPDVELVAGRNIDLQVDKGDTVWKYTVSSEADKVNVLPGEHIAVQRETTDDGADFTIDAVQFPVKIDGDSTDVLYGDGTPENPLGVYDFVGATDSSDGKPGTVPAPAISEREYYLRGDGTWAPIVIPEQVQSDWAEESELSPAFIRNKPDIKSMISRAVSTERDRATEAESELHTEIVTETERATEAETTLHAEIVTETERAIEAETALHAEIVTETERATEAETSLHAEIVTETERATEAETTLHSEIVAETERATEAETTLHAEIVTETERAIEAETALHAEIVTETERATEAETTLHAEIVTETERAIAGEAAATTEVVAGNNVTVDNSVAADGHNIYTVTVNECSAAMMDAWLDEVG